MRLGIVLAGFTSAPLADFVAAAREAEARGYHTAWLGEVSGYDAIVMSTVVATHTEKLHVANGVLPVQTRTPVILGMATASLNHLAPGRFALGIGLSSKTIVEQWHGLTFTPSLAQIRETVEIVRKVASGERVAHEGTHYRVKGFRLTSPPPKAPVRVYLAALVVFVALVASGFDFEQFRDDLQRELDEQRQREDGGRATAALWIARIGVFAGLAAAVVFIALLASGFDFEQFRDDLQRELQERRDQPGGGGSGVRA